MLTRHFTCKQYTEEFVSSLFNLLYFMWCRCYICCFYVLLPLLLLRYYCFPSLYKAFLFDQLVAILSCFSFVFFFEKYFVDMVSFGQQSLFICQMPFVVIIDVLSFTLVCVAVVEFFSLSFRTFRFEFCVLCGKNNVLKARSFWLDINQHCTEDRLILTTFASCEWCDAGREWQMTHMYVCEWMGKEHYETEEDRLRWNKSKCKHCNYNYSYWPRVRRKIVYVTCTYKSFHA